MRQTGYSIGAVARVAHVTVRALRHYDDLGLLRPSGRLESGYRSYSAEDLERLQRILLYRQLGFPLDTINILVNDPYTDPLDHLRRQHALLNERITALRQMVAMVEKIMEARIMGINLDPQEMLEVFGDADHTKLQAEAEERWGDTLPWAQSQRRIANYGKEDWQQLRAEYSALMAEVAAARESGAPATSERAMGLAEAHRAHLERWFYDCAYPMHRGLGDLYVNDPRFTKNFDKIAPGLATYLRDAIYANADRHER
ncbi:MAG TPA: MerR family transcriptional regulator [Ktedonobacterales bacterium]